MNKKGNYSDVVGWMELVIVLVVVFAVVLMFFGAFNTNVQSNDHIPEDTKTFSSGYNNYLPIAMDYLFIFFYVIFLSFSVYSARLIPSNPKFIIVAVFALIGLPFGAMIIDNFLDAFANQPQISAVFSNMLFVPFVIDHLVFFVLAYSLLVGIALLSKEDS